MKKLTYILFAFLICCKNNTFLTNEERIKIYQEKYLSTPDTSFQSKKEQIIYIKKEKKGDDNVLEYSVLEKIGKKWSEKTNKNIAKGIYYSFGEFEYITLKNNEFIYFEEFQPGGNMGNFDLEFVLYNINSHDKYIIHYTELPERSLTKIELRKSDNLFNNKDILNYLEKKLNDSKKTHKPDVIEKLVKEFIIENENKLYELKQQYSVNRSIQFNRKINIEKKLTNKVIDSLRKHSVKFIENNDYYIFSRFKGPVLGYNKNDENLFCVWVPDSSYDWIKEMQFDLMGNLILYNSDDNKAEYLINLYNRKYLRIKKKTYW